MGILCEAIIAAQRAGGSDLEPKNGVRKMWSGLALPHLQCPPPLIPQKAQNKKPQIGVRSCINTFPAIDLMHVSPTPS